MTAIYVDSMAGYDSVADLTQVQTPMAPVQWVDIANTAWSTSGSRWGLGAVKAAGTDNSTALDFSPLVTGIFGCNVYVESGPSGSQFMSICDTAGGVVHLYLKINTSTNKLELYRGDNTLLGTSTNTFNFAVQRMLQVKWNIHDSTGSCVVKVDNVTEINVTGADTRNGGTASVGRLIFRGFNFGTATYVSEVFLFDTNGSVNNDFPGDYRISARRASAAGGSTQWTPSASTNVSNVDDTPGDDGDSTYNSDSTAGHIDTFQFGAIPSSSGTVLAVMTRVVARKDDAGTRQIKSKMRASSTNYNIGSTKDLQLTYKTFCDISETNPNTTAAYTVSEMRATTPEFGYELVS